MENDSIRRQAVLSSLHKRFPKIGFQEDRWWNSTHVLQAINETPSAQPERKRGKWVLFSERSFLVSCSLCGQLVDREWNYCPNCGAQMEGER